MSTTRPAASSSRAQTSRKCRVSPRRAASDTIAQRARTAAALSSCAAPLTASSLVQRTALCTVELTRIRCPRRGEIPCRLLCSHFDYRVERHQAIWDRSLFHYLDPLRLERIALAVRHRYPAIDPTNPEPMKNVRYQLLKAHVLYAGDAFGPTEIGVGRVAAWLSLAGVVDEELGDFAERPPLLAVVDDDPDPALLCGLDTDFDPVDEV